MFLSDLLPEATGISVLRDGDTICVSMYGQLSPNRLGEVEHQNVLAQAMGLAVEMDIFFIVEEANDGA